MNRDQTEALFDDLYPILRSITGEGYRRSLDLLREYLPLQNHLVPSGTKVFDWIVPPEWGARNARLLGPGGEVVADMDVSNLHVLNYSMPVDGEFSLDELQGHLFSLPHLPEAVPYVTSYYKRQWGFCISETVRKALQPGRYHAKIDSEFSDGGGVVVADAVLKGESDKEILLTSYLCHPSLANNELSGPLVLAQLYQRLSKWPRRRFTYRFLINPETIGALCYLHLKAQHLREHMVGGLVLTCMGGPEPKLSYKLSRNGASFMDQLAGHLSRQDPDQVTVRPFSPVGGSDERQYCSPGFNMPMLQVGRSLYGEYDGYHNSYDTKEFMGIDKVIDSAERVEEFLKLAEISYNFVNLCPFGEPQLGRRNLYPNSSWTGTYDTRSTENKNLLPFMLHLLNFADGTRPIIELCEQNGFFIGDLREALEVLEREMLLEMEGKRK